MYLSPSTPPDCIYPCPVHETYEMCTTCSLSFQSLSHSMRTIYTSGSPPSSWAQGYAEAVVFVWKCWAMMGVSFISRFKLPALTDCWQRRCGACSGSPQNQPRSLATSIFTLLCTTCTFPTRWLCVCADRKQWELHVQILWWTRTLLSLFGDSGSHSFCGSTGSEPFCRWIMSWLCR